jgi:hypothetical protein
MQNFTMSIWMVWFLMGSAVLAFLSWCLVMIRDWWRETHHAGDDSNSGAAVSALLDARIATQWTEGRTRLGFLLTLMRELRASLEQDVETLSRLDPSGAEYEREVRRRVEPTLRRFSFDKHLWEECRVLVPFLQFCGKDLAKSQGLNTAPQLKALDDVQAALGAVHGH